MSVESTLLIIFTSLALLSLWTALSLICFSLLSGWWDRWSSQKYKYSGRLTTSVKNRRKDHSWQPFYCAGFGSHQSCQIFEPKTAIMTPIKKVPAPENFDHFENHCCWGNIPLCVCRMCDPITAQLSRIRFNSVYYVGICVDTTRDCSLDKEPMLLIVGSEADRSLVSLYWRGPTPLSVQGVSYFLSLIQVKSDI